MAAEYAKTGTAEEAAKVRDIVSQLGSNPGVLKAMKPEYALEITRGLMRLGREGDDVKELGKLFQNLPEAARKALPGMLAGLPAEAQKLLLAGLNG